MMTFAACVRSLCECWVVTATCVHTRERKKERERERERNVSMHALKGQMGDDRQEYESSEVFARTRVMMMSCVT